MSTPAAWPVLGSHPPENRRLDQSGKEAERHQNTDSVNGPETIPGLPIPPCSAQPLFQSGGAEQTRNAYGLSVRKNSSSSRSACSFS